MTRLRSPHPSAWLQSAKPSLAVFILTLVAIPAAFARLAAGLIGG